MIKIIAPALFAIALFSGCDKISEEKHIQEEPILTEDNGKRVLLEDFTGQKCSKCPLANEIAADIKNTYGDRVSVIEIHAGYFAIPAASGDKYLTDFRNPEGEELSNFFGVTQNPIGMINRIGGPEPALVLKDRDAWKGLVDAELKKDPVGILTTTHSYQTSNRTGSITVTSEFLENYSESTKLIVYLTEDSLVGWQTKGVEHIPNYVHRHVLRGALKGAFGEDLTTAPVLKGAKQSKTYNFTLPADYVDRHCALVAVLANKATYEILNVSEVKITE